MSGLPPALTKHVGPLPVGGWILAVGGGLLAARYLKNRAAANASAATAVAPDPTTITPTTAPTGGLGGAAVSDPTQPGNTNAPTSVDNAGDGTTGAPPVESNGQWRQQAIKYLVGAGIGAIAAGSAVDAYLNGMPMTAGQATLINRTVAGIGPTPAAVPTPSIIPVIKNVTAPVKIVHHPAPKPAHHPAPKHPAPKHHSPIRHHTHPTTHQHAHPAAPPATRRDAGHM